MDYSKWELNQIIYDPQWLADLFKCIVSLKNHRNEQINIKEGLIEKKYIIQNFRESFSNISTENEQFLLNLLLKFEIFISYPQDENLLVIPFLMDNQIPKSMIDDWNNFERISNSSSSNNNNNQIQKSGRGYIFPFLLEGILSKIIYGFNHPLLQSLSLILRFWKNGILLSWKKSNLLIQYFNPNNNNNSSNDTYGTVLLGLPRDELLTLRDAERHGLGTSDLGSLTIEKVSL